ncbi:MAG TPA: aspartate/glutamate racemase family protein [Thermoanaerobaculia bacterium]|jgi:glutamate racemase
MSEATDTALLDWGIGGLSVYNEIRKRDPERSLLYLSDAGAVPYGLMPRAVLTRRVREIAGRLAGLGIRRLVVACNAASTVLPDLATAFRRLDLQVTGVIEHGVALVEKGDYQKVGILGGRRTVLSRSYARPLRQSGRAVRGRVAQPLSALIEQGDLESAALTDLLRRLLAPLRSMDAVVLACTHYPAIRPQIQKLLPGVDLIDPAEATAEHVHLKWPHPKVGEGLAPSRAGGGAFFTTGDPASMRRAAARAFGNRLETIGMFGDGDAP